jgi:hypothetical protein
MLSPIFTTVESTEVVVPDTVKLPDTITLFENVLLPAIVCAPEVLTTVLSTSIVIVSSPDWLVVKLPPVCKPSPADIVIVASFAAAGIVGVFAISVE